MHEPFSRLPEEELDALPAHLSIAYFRRGDVIVHCQVGLRGHNAARILTNLGYDVANLDGSAR